ENGTLPAAPGRTATELAERRRPRPPRPRRRFASAADVFNDVTYGELAGHPEQYRMIVALDDELVARPPASSDGSTGAAPQQDWAALG
ncbi:DUF4129 domain-containing protein, partial [Mycobacterium rufum]|nr:DUF4129 domain-containing protein [Mycolicibacterium rufum]